jgi:3-oxoacyl-[acyl-carrier-protein] synthase II
MMGSALGGVGYAESLIHDFILGGAKGLNPMLALSVFGGAASCNIAIELGLMGRTRPTR